MEDTLLVRDQTILDMQAWRGVFQERADAGDGEAIVIKEPRDVTAVLTPVDAKELVGSTNRLGPDAFEIVWMPSPRATSLTRNTKRRRGSIARRRRAGARSFGPELARLGCSGARGGGLSTARPLSCATRWTESSASR